MPEQPPTLRDMINAEHERGTTYRELGSRAVDPETHKKASGSTFYDIATGRLDRMPQDYRLRAIAAALKVPYERVRQAAIAQWVPAGDPNEERRHQLAEAERLREIADEARARADEALASIEREAAGGNTARPKSA
jgi:hypothetical protein